jgi:hypothetical protein
LQIKSQAVYKSQAEALSSRLTTHGTGRPAILAYYQQLRDDSRVDLLRTIKYSALALRFWGLRNVAKFASPHLLSHVDQLEAHMDIL